jgi:hypothetical protein
VACEYGLRALWSQAHAQIGVADDSSDESCCEQCVAGYHISSTYSYQRMISRMLRVSYYSITPSHACKKAPFMSHLNLFHHKAMTKRRAYFLPILNPLVM